MKVDLTKDVNQVLTGKDGIVIRKHIAGVEGGRVLDVTGYTAETIPAGVVVITDGNGVYKPLLPAIDGTYTLPANHSYVGLVECTVLTKTPAVAILLAGVVNEAALPYAVTSAVKTALKNIIFVKDEVA